MELNLSEKNNFSRFAMKSWDRYSLGVRNMAEDLMSSGEIMMTVERYRAERANHEHLQASGET
jgi:hypothetical protein